MTARSPGRFGALDLLRGITIAAMIVVNNPGDWNSTFPQLTHAAWNGVTVADLIFPAFIFIMGVALALGLGSRAGDPPRAGVYRRIASRGLLLVLLGLALNAAAAWPEVATIRIPGVLQRIGVTYLFAAALIVGLPARWTGLVAGALILLHWGLLALPLGLPMGGSLEPGLNVGVALDRALFGSHLLRATGDPEGTLGLLTSVATALMGAEVGRWIRRDTQARAAGVTSQPPILPVLAVAGGLAIAAGYAWSLVLPLNKSLWTGSFALLACGVSTVSLILLARIDGPRSRPVTAPFLWLGTNPLVIYFLSELLTNVIDRPWLRAGRQLVAPKEWVYWSVVVPAVHDNGGVWSSLAYALLYTLLWIAVAGAMRWRGVRLSL